MEKNIRLIAIDLDDTLLDNNIQVSPRACAAIRAAVKRGITVTLATGRMFASAVIFAKQIGLDVPLITYNGGLIRSSLTSETFLHQPVPVEVAGEILKLFDQHRWYIQSYVEDKLYVDELDDYALTYARFSKITPIAIGKELYTMKAAPTKLLGMTEEKNVKPLIHQLMQLFPGKLYATSSKPGYVEMMHPSVNKGQALSFLASKLGISQAEVMAVGDSLNDIDMLEFAGFGVAMGNAVPEVKAVAQAVTLRNNEDGVAEAIEKYALGGNSLHF
jgi:Cof subfamily protein (haloacid dehalogenase superfamily)